MHSLFCFLRPYVKECEEKRVLLSLEEENDEGNFYEGEKPTCRDRSDRERILYTLPPTHVCLSGRQIVLTVYPRSRLLSLSSSIFTSVERLFLFFYQPTSPIRAPPPLSCRDTKVD